MRAWTGGKMNLGTVVLLVSILSSACTSGGSPADERTDVPTGAPSIASTPATSNGSPQNSGESTKKLGPMASKKVSLPDPPNDAQTSGQVPPYIEILGANVEGAGGEGVRLILRMSGEVPQAMPDDRTHMIVAWNLAGTKKATGAGFTAQAGTEGWMVSSAQGSVVVDFTGTFTVDGTLLILTVPWDFIDGARKFEWSASASWFSSSDDGSSSSSADNITGGRYR